MLLIDVTISNFDLGRYLWNYFIFVMIKGRQTYSFVVGFLTQGEAFGALISQASTYNSYVSG